jgi:hypothetical protein
MKGCLRLFLVVWLVFAAGSPGCGRIGLQPDTPLSTGSVKVRVQFAVNLTETYNLFELTWAGTFLAPVAVDVPDEPEPVSDTRSLTPSQVAELAGVIEFETRGYLQPGEWEVSVLVTGVKADGSDTIQSHLCTPEIYSGYVTLVLSDQGEPECIWNLYL